MNGINGKAEPRFDLDYGYGRDGELHVAQILDMLGRGNGQVEVKRKRLLDLNFYVETHCDKGRTGTFQPSGISVTTAGMWAFVIAETGVTVLCPADELRAMLDDPSTKECEERDGSCPTKGKLVSLAVLLYRHKKATSQPTVTAPLIEPASQATTAPHSRDSVPLLTADDINW